MNRNKTIAPVALTVISLGVSGQAGAAPQIDLGNGTTLDWGVKSTYTVSKRLDDQDPVLADDAGGNDGNNNFDKGALTANRLGLLLDAHLRKGEHGFVLSASAFYDDAYQGTNDNPGPVNKPGPVNEFTDEAVDAHGQDARVLDAYAYTSFEVGDEGYANVRLGRHVVSWGEGLFFPGISLAQGPADGTKSGIPGTEVKDQLLPEDQISLTYEVNSEWSVLAHAQYGWHKTVAPAPGSYLNTSDGVGPGGSCLGPYTSIPAVPGAFGGFEGCSFGERGEDITPDETGQWGLGTRYRITDETELGLYYLNYHDRTPLPEINAFTPGTPVPAFFGIPGNQIGNGSYNIRYFDDIKLLGATFSTTTGIASIAGEFSYKEGAPVLVDTVVDPASGAVIPNPTRADIMQANLNAFVNLGRTAISPQTLFITEVSHVKITNVEKRKAPGVEALGPAAAFFPETDKLSMDDSATAFAATLSLTYPGIAQGWDLAVPISYSRQVSGRSILGGVGGEGDSRISIGGTFTHTPTNIRLGVTYLGYLGGANLAPLREQRLLTDRDQISFFAKYDF